MPRYLQNLLFAGFEIEFTALFVIFLGQWRLFCVDWKYSCQVTCKNYYSPVLKSDLQHYLCYF